MLPIDPCGDSEELRRKNIPSIHYLSPSMRGWSCWVKAGYTLGRSAVYHTSDIQRQKKQAHSHPRAVWCNQLTCMTLDCEGRPEHPEEPTQTRGEHTYSSMGIFLLNPLACSVAPVLLGVYYLTMATPDLTACCRPVKEGSVLLFLQQVTRK